MIDYKTNSPFYERVQKILRKDLGMTKVYVWWVICLRKHVEKFTKLITLQENLILFEADPTGFLGHLLRLVLVHHFESEIKRKSM